MRFQVNDSIERVRDRIEVTIFNTPSAPGASRFALEAPRIFGSRQGLGYEVRTVCAPTTSIYSSAVISLSPIDAGVLVSVRFSDGAWYSAPRAILLPIAAAGAAYPAEWPWREVGLAAAFGLLWVGALPLLLVSLRDRRRIRETLYALFPEAVPAA